MLIQVLGTIDVLDPAEVALGGPTQRRVLSALLLHANAVVSVDQLVDAVWPDGGVPERADHNVRTYVHRLRTALGEVGDRIETAGTGYRLRVERDELDATRFEDLVDRARQLAGEADAEGARQLLDEALGLWRGRPFDEFADEEWTRAEVTRLGEVRASAVEHRFAALLDAGRHTEVVGPLREAVGEEPWREARRIQLALALYRSGRQAEALRAIQRYQSELADEIGLVPSAELDQLEHRILEHDPTLVLASHRQHMLRDYQLDEVIGEGAFSLVWRGTQPSLGRKVAIKQIRAELANQPDFVRRFETEAQTVAALEHPHIVPLYDYWREPDSAYLVMRYVAGGSLESEVLDGGLDEARLRRLVDQVGSALHTAHRVGVIHRDVKSANVLLDAEGNFYLTDFGIAFTGSAADDELATALSTGSPAYASPEQLRRQALDSRTDMYGFGITLFEAATGRLPFVDAPTQAALVKRQLEDPVPTPSSVKSGVPVWVDQLIARATAKNPSDRFGSMAELMAAVPDRSAGTTDRGQRVAAAAVIGELVNPFKALRAFREADAADFYGRDRLVARFVDVLSRPGSAGRLLAVVGPSGSGKSSAVRSGLLPRLRTGAIAGSGDWFITTMLPGSHPFDELESALSRVAVRQPGPLVEMMRGDDRGIARAINQILPDEDSELLLVIDQFEEMFTHTADEERAQFLKGLLAAVCEPRTRLRIVVTIRADFLDGPLRHPQLATRLETGTETVSPLAADELEAAIVEPVRRQGATYEPGLVARIMADVGDQPGALPLLQYALTELFDANVSGLLRAESYDAIGGLTGALATRADDTLTAMNLDQQAAARRLFGRLVNLGDGTEDTRRRVRRRELGDGPDMTKVIDTFGAVRLLVFDHDTATREPTVEIAHEALLQAWPRLGSWLDNDRDELRTLRGIGAATDAWLASDRDDGELARSGRLDTVSELAGRRPDVLNDYESEWVSASQAAATAAEQARDSAAVRDRSQNRRLRQLLVTAACLVVVALIAAGTAVVLRNRAVANAEQALAAEQNAVDAQAEAVANAEQAIAAEQNAVDAEAEAVANAEQAIAAEQDADIERLTALSAAQIAVAPDVAILLALQANRRRDDIGTQSAVQRAIAAEATLANIFPGRLGESERIHFSRDGSVGMTHSASIEIGRVQWFEPQTDVQIGNDFTAPAGIIEAAISGDGSVAALALVDGTVRFVDITGVELARPYTLEGPANALSLDQSGGRLLVSDVSTTRIVDVATGDLVSTYSVGEGAFSPGREIDAALSDDGSYFVLEVLRFPTEDEVAVTGRSVIGGYDIVDAITAERRERVEDDRRNGPEGSNIDQLLARGSVLEVTSLFLSTDDQLLVGYSDGTVATRSVGDVTSTRTFQGPVGAVIAVGAAPDGTIAASSTDGLVHFWAADGTVLLSPVSVGGHVEEIAFADNGVAAMALKGGGIAAVDRSNSVMIDQRWDAVDGFSVSAFHGFYENIDEPTEFDFYWQLRQLSNNEIVVNMPVATAFPHGFGNAPIYSADGEWSVTFGELVDAPIRISEILGDQQFDVDVHGAYEQAFGSWPTMSSSTIRPGPDGQRVFAAVRDAAGGPTKAFWVDSATSEIVAGPIEFDAFGAALVLDDGRVVVGGARFTFNILAADLRGPPIVVEGTQGFSTFDSDPASGLVLVGGLNGDVGLVDVDAGSLELLEQVPGLPTAGAFSSDGRRIAVLSTGPVPGAPTQVQLIDVATGQRIGVPMRPFGTEPSASGVSWADDGSGVWVSTEDGPVRFAADPTGWREIACGIVHRELTSAEWRLFVSDTDPQVSACT
jgi:DNA-binding SARP family transcriptional activator